MISRRHALATLAAAVAAPWSRAGGAASPPVRVGLERLDSEAGSALRGKSLGLLSHGASVTLDGRHAVDVLRESGLDVRRLFSPEHGPRGRAAAGEAVASRVDATTGLPLVSLYGERTKPAPADLEGLDVLVVDLQGAGVRFYTYVSTLLLCLEATAGAGVGLCVLDRPNPLGGDLVEGPVRDGSVPESLVSTAPGPLVHGLTLGEMARFANARRDVPGRVSVVPMAGWSRAMTWRDTRRPWTPPSPNLRTADAALVYPGTCLLEATNVSEGRGSDDPFRIFGSPWLRPETVESAVEAPGLALERTRFTPASSPAAPHPKHLGVVCTGFRVSVEKPQAVRPYAFGLNLLAALRRQPEFGWTGGGAGLNRLLGTTRVHAALERGEPVEEILAADAPAIERFKDARRPSLLY